MRISGISSGFPGLSQSEGQVAHVLRTRSPLIPGPKPGSPFDLHVLSAPPAFVLSQDQTLRREFQLHRSARGLSGSALFCTGAGPVDERHLANRPGPTIRCRMVWNCMS